MKPMLQFGLSIALLAAAAVMAGDTGQTEYFKQKLAAMPKPELAATAAELVKAAKNQERESTTRGVVKAAIKLHRASAPAVVGAIAQADQDMAAGAARAAASERPEMAAAVARAAASAAPSKAAGIVAAVCRAVPNAYRTTAVAVAQAVPGSGKEILEAVAAALPDLRPGIDRALTASSGNLSVASVLESVSSTAGSHTPPSGTATNAVSGNVPPAGRNYAAP